MPIFEYECRKCGKPFEFLQRSADSQATCPFCETDTVERLVSLCAVSSESTRAANLSGAHNRAATKRNEKQRSEHAHHHGHFEDTATPKGQLE